MPLPQYSRTEPYKDQRGLDFNRQPLPILERRKIGAQSYVSERLNRIRKQRAKVSKISADDEKQYMKQKQLQQLKKNLIVSPNKVMSNERIVCSYEPFRKQLEMLRRKPNSYVNYEEILSNLHPFSNAIRELGIQKLEDERKAKKREKQFLRHRKMVDNQVLTPYLNPYRSMTRKKSQNLNINSQTDLICENGLKPNNSQIQIKSEDSYFLSIGKINLVDPAQRVLYNNNIPIKKNGASSFPNRLQNLSIEYYGDDEDQETFEDQYLKRGSLKLPRMQRNQKVYSYSNIRKVQELQQNSEEQQQPPISKTIDPRFYPQQQTSITPNIIDRQLCPQQIHLISKTIDPSFQQQQNTQFIKPIDRISSPDRNQSSSISPSKKNNIPRTHQNKKLIVPFQTYYYRSLLWKINFSNGVNVEIPSQYEHRIKAYIGKGNNSALIRGLVKRRTWFTITDRIQEANFVWTQLKSLPYFKLQASFEAPADKEQQQLIQQTDNTYTSSLFPKSQIKLFQKYMKQHQQSQQRTDQRLLFRNKFFKYQRNIKTTDFKGCRLQNHLINNYIIGNKKALFHTMSTYYTANKRQVFDYLPLTFHVRAGLQDPVYFKFLKYYYACTKKIKEQTQNDSKSNSKNIWIVKPGENSNRGNGIKVCLTLDQIKNILKKKQAYSDGTYRTYILQQYIQNPMLYHRRKFDIRHYMMISCVNGYIKGYWYQNGYVRTTSTEYSLKTNVGAIHLTNDAVQKNLPDYGKYEKGNKISYDELNDYLSKKYPKSKVSFKADILPRMKQLSTDVIRASSSTLCPNKLQNNFQVFGLDFMLDSDFKLYLIEVNSNPCLEISCPLLGGIIPRMVQNLLEITMDAMYPPPARYYMKGVHYQKNLEQWNRFELVYDQKVEGKVVYQGVDNIIDMKLLEEEDDVFEDDGEQWNEDS